MWHRETLQLSVFHYIIQLTATFYESMVLERRDLPVARQWGQRWICVSVSLWSQTLPLRAGVCAISAYWADNTQAQCCVQWWAPSLLHRTQSLFLTFSPSFYLLPGRPRPPPTTRLHYAIQAYYEMLQYIQQMGISKNKSLQESSKVMLSNLVYHQEYRDVFVSLIRNFNQVIQVRLRQLATCIYVLVYTCTCTYMYIHVLTHLNLHMYIHVHVFCKGWLCFIVAFVYICTYIHTHQCAYITISG